MPWGAFRGATGEYLSVPPPPCYMLAIPLEVYQALHHSHLARLTPPPYFLIPYLCTPLLKFLNTTLMNLGALELDVGAK